MRILSAILFASALTVSAAAQTAFGPQQIITTDAAGVKSVLAADLDGDGDQDVLSASYADDKIDWYENMDGGWAPSARSWLSPAMPTV